MNKKIYIVNVCLFVTYEGTYAEQGPFIFDSESEASEAGKALVETLTLTDPPSGSDHWGYWVSEPKMYPDLKAMKAEAIQAEVEGMRVQAERSAAQTEEDNVAINRSYIKGLAKLLD